MKFTLYILLALLISSFEIKAQDPVSTPEEYDSLYAINIQLSRINGAYIPRDLSEAHKRIIELTDGNKLDGFAKAEEKEVCKKLHFGIGRWMILNWNFYDGSRLSHYLKQEGLLHPDDMAQYILRTLHRHLNQLELQKENIIAELKEARMKEINEVYINDKN